MKAAALAVFGIIAVAFIIILFGTSYTIDEGERGILLRNGKVTSIAEAGRGYKTPIIDEVVKLDLRTQALEIKLAAYSKDQQPAEMSITVNYHVVPSEVRGVYTTYGSLEALSARLIAPRVLEETKTIFGGYTAVSSIQDRGKFNADVQNAIAKSVAGPVIVDGVQITNLDFSDAYEQAVESRMMAEVEVAKLRQNSEREKVQLDITVTQAQAKADSVRKAADGAAYATQKAAEAEATAIKLTGDATAAAIKARGDALKDNPGLVALTIAEKWSGVLPSTMLPGGSVPLLDLKQ
jgi:regulator of protease activity HflC (stomatin/prohibitin superfamily)